MEIGYTSLQGINGRLSTWSLKSMRLATVTEWRSQGHKTRSIRGIMTYHDQNKSNKQPDFQKPLVQRRLSLVTSKHCNFEVNPLKKKQDVPYNKGSLLVRWKVRSSVFEKKSWNVQVTRRMDTNKDTYTTGIYNQSVFSCVYTKWYNSRLLRIFRVLFVVDTLR